MQKYVIALSLWLLAAAAISAQTPSREGFITTRDGVRLYYQIYGESGDTIIHLHGGPGGSLVGQLPRLTKLSERHVLISYDQRGGGRSLTDDTLSITASVHVRDLEDLRVGLSIPRMTLYGHSWGVALATMYAAEHPARVRQLVLNGPMPPARVPFDAQRWAGISEAVTRLCERRAAGHDQPKEVYVEQCRADPTVQSRVYYHDTLKISRSPQRAQASGPAVAPVAQRRTLASLGDWDFRPLMRQVHARVLVVEGEHTPIPLDQIQIWAGTFPNGRLLLVPATGHAYPHIENPDYFFPALEEFLSGGWPRMARE